MSIGSCTSCSPVIDAVKLASNPKADTNGDGKLTSVELQNTNLTKGTEAENKVTNNPDTLKADARNKTDTRNQPDTTYVAQRNPSLASSNNILLLPQHKSNA